MFREDRVSRNVIAAIVAAVVVLVGVLVGAQLLGGDDSTDISGADEVAALLKGLPQEGNVLGRASAPVTVTEYIDYKCPVCAAASQGVVPTIIERYVRPGRVKLVLKPIAFIGPDSETGALAGFAMARQDRMWNFTETLLKNQGNEAEQWLTEDVATAAAAAVGGDEAKFATDFADTNGLAEELNTNSTEFDRVTAGDPQPGTPYWTVARPGRETARMSGAAPEPVLNAIDEALGQ